MHSTTVISADRSFEADDTSVRIQLQLIRKLQFPLDRLEARLLTEGFRESGSVFKTTNARVA